MAQDRPTTLIPILGRVFWMLVGPMILFILTINIVNLGNGWFTPVDIGFMTVLAGVILVRWLEFRSGNAQTATGEPATPAHFYRFVVGALVLGAAVWVAANLVANHWLER